MIKPKMLSNLVFASILSIGNAACVASDYETWTEQMTCGEAQYKLESVCKKSNKEFTLNECKPQTLEIMNKSKVRKVTLPELNKFNALNYKKDGGDINELFVIQWGCGQADKMKIASLYYSVGGGSSSTSESTASYDEYGKLIEHEKNQKYEKAMNDSFRHLKSIRSIMPD